MQKERLKYLLYKYLIQSLTEVEGQELDNFIGSHPALPHLLKQVEDEATLYEAVQRMVDFNTQKNLALVWAGIHEQQNSRKRIVKRFSGKWTKVLFIRR